MKNLTQLFRLMEISRAQNQQGYILAEIPKSDISDLAQHHFLVTFLAWQLGRLVIRAGSKISLEKVLEFALVHDLGELLGGDIAMPYAKANPAARTAAKKFELQNLKYFTRFFGADKTYVRNLTAEMLSAKSDEALIAKIADYIEVTHYKLYVRRLSQGDISMAVKKIQEKLKRVKDAKARSAIETFIKQWPAELQASAQAEIFEEAKSK